MKKVLKRSLSLLLAITIIFSSAYVGLAEVDFGSINITNPFAVKVNAASESDMIFTLNNDGESYSVRAGNKELAGELVVPSVYNGLPVTEIGENAFQNCQWLTSITIPDSVTRIGDSAFGACELLTTITIPDSVTSIGVGIIDGTQYYDDLSNWQNDALYINNHLIEVKDSIRGNYTVKSGTKSIADEAFRGCGLTTVNIPDGVTSIGDYAFMGCQALTTITIPYSVANIGCAPFKDSHKITSITIDNANKYYCFDNGVLFNKSKTELIQCCVRVLASSTSYTIPDSVTSIGNYAFSCCESLLSITIPDSVTSIGDYAFYGCKRLTSITIPDGVVSIGTRVFENCLSLESVKISDSVTSIGFRPFHGCENLISVSLGNGISYVDDYMFEGCYSLESVVIGDNVQGIGHGAFNCCINLTFIDIPDGVIGIGDNAFKECEKLSEIVLPDSLKYIGYNAFYNCVSLTTITIPDDVEYIFDDAFVCCTSLTSITIPDSVISVGNYAFAGCSNLSSVTIGEGVTRIGEHAFGGCSNLNKVYWNAVNVADFKYSSDVFVDAGTSCSGIDVVFGHTVEKIPAYLFCSSGSSYNPKVTSVTFYDGVTSIGEYAFSGCTSLTSITIPGSVTSIGEHTFSNCTSLFSITILNGVTKIGNHAFSDCTSLTYMFMSLSVTNIGKYAFSNCIRLSDVYYEGSEEQWKKIYIGYYNESLLNADIIFGYNIVLPDFPGYVPTVVNNGAFKCDDFTYSGENGFDYKDSYFYKPATEYNHELATMSLCLALSTFRDKDDSENSGDNVISVLKQCGFENEEYDTLTTVPGTDTIGYAIAKKQIGDTTLIVCAVRSGGYQKEWASNVTLGETRDHYGFNDAANKVLGIKDDNGIIKKTGSGILGYIDNPDNEITGNVKVWLTGYSRGAATATQAAAKLNSEEVVKLLEPKVDYSMSDVYAYGFATPAGAISGSNPQSTDYANIHNILHFNDLVPRVAPKDWDFGWYGNIYYLPFKENDSLASFKIEKMRETLEKYDISFISLSNFIDFLIYDEAGNFRGSPGVVSDDLVKNLAGKIESRADYVDDYQYLLRSILGEGITEKALVQVGKILVGIITGKINKIIGNNPNDVAKQIEEIEKTDELDKNLLKVVGEIILATASTHGTSGAYYLSWMQAMPDGSWLNNGDYRNILVNCPVDVYVYDSNGKLVAAIVNEEVVDIENSPINYGVDINGQKVFYLPVDGEYDIKIEAREDCETTVTINEYTACSGTSEHVVTYTDIPMEADEVLESTVSEMVEVTADDGTTETEAEYVVEKNDDVIEPTIDIADEEVENYTYTVDVSCDETKGVVYGGGVFTIGEFCQITAENKPGYKFSKWTVNGETVSTESTYRFAVTEDVTIVAEYVPCEHPKYKAEVVAPTCTVDGYTKHTCEVCSHSYNDNIVKSNGHSSSDWIIDEDKHTMHTECTVCKDILETKNITVAATKLTSCYNEVKGVQLKWDVVSGAKSYKVYRKLPSQTEWVEIKSTTALEYQDTNVTGNTVYQYSVKAVDQYGNESDYSPQRECRFIETPTLLSRTNAVGGVTIKWKKVAGATSYRIYRRGAGVNYWYYLGDFPATLDTFTDLETANYFPDDASKNALAKPKSGNYYRYTVRASYDGEDSTGKDYLIYSGFDTNGLYLKYVATPKLTSITNATNGLQIKWNAVAGGGPVEYRVYRRGAGSTYWYYLGTTTNTTWTDSGVKVANGGYYRYTVRAVAGTNGKGWYSAFDTTGLYLMRLANPTLNSATSSTAGITVKWGAVKGTTGYYVYRKTANSSWVRIASVGGTNNTTFLDKTAKKGTTYTYTVRAVYGATTSAYNAGISCYDKY